MIDKVHKGNDFHQSSCQCFSDSLSLQTPQYVYKTLLNDSLTLMDKSAMPSFNAVRKIRNMLLTFI